MESRSNPLDGGTVVQTLGSLTLQVVRIHNQVEGRPHRSAIRAEGDHAPASLDYH